MIMNETTILSHQLEFPDPEDELEFLEERLQRFPGKIAGVSENLGVGFDAATSVLGLRTALKRPHDEIVTALRDITQWGVALFQRAVVSKSDTVKLFISGQEVVVPGGNSYYNSAPRWLLAAGAAMTLRDNESLKRLCAFDVSWWGGSYDEYHNVYVDAVMAYVNQSGDWNKLLDSAATWAANAEKFPERGKRLGLPLIAVTRSVMQGDEDAFNTHLADGLTWYQTMYKRSPDKRDPVGVVPLRYLGWCAQAHDRGLVCRVVSDYIPAWLVSP